MGEQSDVTPGSIIPGSITPDRKDWTWVLHRPCPECAFDAAALPPTEVGVRVRANATAWLQVLGRADVRERPAPGVWSPLEYAAHVRDVHRIFGRRLELMLGQDDPLFDSWDQDSTAVVERYAEQDPATVAAELVAAAKETGSAFDAVPDGAWSRTGRRSDGAVFTVESFGRYYAHDWVHHLHDVGAAP